MAFVKPRFLAGELDAQNSLRFLDTNGLPNVGQTTTPSVS